jgi:hypothetical protein
MFPPSGPEKPASGIVPFGDTTTAEARLSGPQLKIRRASSGETHGAAGE